MKKNSFDDQRQIVVEWLGSGFSALMCGLEMQELESWGNEYKPTRAQCDTMRNAYRLWKMLHYYDNDTVKLWLTTENRYLNNVWPLMVIAHYPQDVYSLAQQWITDGEKVLDRIT